MTGAEGGHERIENNQLFFVLPTVCGLWCGKEGATGAPSARSAVNMRHHQGANKQEFTRDMHSPALSSSINTFAPPPHRHTYRCFPDGQPAKQRDRQKISDKTQRPKAYQRIGPTPSSLSVFPQLQHGFLPLTCAPTCFGDILLGLNVLKSVKFAWQVIKPPVLN